MGVQGLLPLLRSITRAIHIREYEGQKVAIDAYSWLHKGAYSCSKELCEGIPTERCVSYCMGRIELLQRHGVVPIVIFDGGKLPMKANEENTRSRHRSEHLQKARAFAQSGNFRAAQECYQRAVDITPVVAKGFIEALKQARVEFIVAPYEADAQMAYLAIERLVDAVITEDSDLLPYGCPKVLFKLDKTGEGQEIKLEDLPANKDPSFVGFTHHMFLELCIFAGCDFLKALPGIGIKKAFQHMRWLKSFVKVCKSLRFNGVAVPSSYEVDFQRAIWTFQHQRVFCPQRQQLVHLHQLPVGGLANGAYVPAALPADASDPLDFLGPFIPDHVAKGIALGDLDPFTYTKLSATEAAPTSAPQLLEVQNSRCNRQASTSSQRSGLSKPLPVQKGQKGGIMDYFANMLQGSSHRATGSSLQRTLVGPENIPSKPAATSEDKEASICAQRHAAGLSTMMEHCSGSGSINREGHSNTSKRPSATVKRAVCALACLTGRQQSLAITRGTEDMSAQTMGSDEGECHMNKENEVPSCASQSPPARIHGAHNGAHCNTASTAQPNPLSLWGFQRGPTGRTARNVSMGVGGGHADDTAPNAAQPAPIPAPQRHECVRTGVDDTHHTALDTPVPQATMSERSASPSMHSRGTEAAAGTTASDKSGRVTTCKIINTSASNSIASIDHVASYSAAASSALDNIQSKYFKTSQQTHVGEGKHSGLSTQLGHMKSTGGNECGQGGGVMASGLGQSEPSAPVCGTEGVGVAASRVGLKRRRPASGVNDASLLRRPFAPPRRVSETSAKQRAGTGNHTINGLFKSFAFTSGS